MPTQLPPQVSSGPLGSLRLAVSANINANYDRNERKQMRLTLLHSTLFAGLAVLTISPSAPVSINDFQSFPQFNRVFLLDTTPDTSANISIADLNEDGNLDILLVNGRHWPGMSRIFIGDGRGHFITSYDLCETRYRSYSGHLVDIDGDGHLDVVLSNDTPDPKVVYLNDGTGHFHLGSTFGNANWETRNASIADLNGDGLPDIIVANRTNIGAANYFCLNKGKGRFDTDGVAFSHESATTITPADFNHDGLIDLAVPNRDGGQSYVYFNGGNATFSDTARVPFGPPDARIRMAEVADLDGDGCFDIVYIDEERGVFICFGKKDGTFSPSFEIADGKVTPYALAVSDLKSDGKIDIVVGHVEAPSTIYFNDGSGHHYSPIQFGDAMGTVYGFAIADLDKDGLLDIAVARSGAPSVVYFADSQRSKAR